MAGYQESKDARHTDTIKTPEARRAFADLLCDHWDDVTRAQQDVIDFVRRDPNKMLELAFVPTIGPIPPGVSLELEAKKLDMDDPERKRVVVKMKFAGAKYGDVGVRFLWEEKDRKFSVTPQYDEYGAGG